jgi:hypothetical protein
MEGLEDENARPRQVRYQAALRPDICCFFDSKPRPGLETCHHDREMVSDQVM